MIANYLFSFYKNRNLFLKFVLVPLLIVGCVLWVIGNLANLKTLIMFMVGLLVGAILYFFFGHYIEEFINTIISWFHH